MDMVGGKGTKELDGKDLTQIGAGNVEASIGQVVLCLVEKVRPGNETRVNDGHVFQLNHLVNSAESSIWECSPWHT